MSILSSVLGILKRIAGAAGGGRYEWIIDIRPMLEKHKLRIKSREIAAALGLPKRRVVKVPHITLVYNFRPKTHPRMIIETVMRVASSYSSLGLYYDGVVARKREKGRGYVIAFKVSPSKELLAFQKQLYNAIRDMIDEAPKSRTWNQNLWFHATIALGVDRSTVYKLNTVQPDFLFPSEVFRIALVRRGRIVYEYDHLTRRILTRSEALSKQTYAEDLRVYRRARGLEATVRSYTRRGGGKTWVIADPLLGDGKAMVYNARPFINTREMDNIIIRNWNNLVAPHDTVFIIGNLAARSKISIYAGRLNGRKIFIGSYSRKGIAYNKLAIEYRGQRFILQHQPTAPPPGYWVIHGGRHNSDLRNYPFVNPARRTINASIELTRYKPVSLDTIIDMVGLNDTLIELPQWADPERAAAQPDLGKWRPLARWRPQPYP